MQQEQETIEAVQIIKRNGDHLLDLVNDILDLSKIEADKCTVDLQKCSPRRLCRCHFADAGACGCEGTAADARVRGAAFPRRSRLIRPAYGRSSSISSAMPSSSPRSAAFGSWCNWTSKPKTEPKLRFDVIDTGIGLSEEQNGTLFQAVFSGGLPRQLVASGAPDWDWQSANDWP